MFHRYIVLRGRRMLHSLSQDTFFNRLLVGLLWYVLLFVVFTGQMALSCLWVGMVVLVGHYEICGLNKLSMHKIIRDLLLSAILSNLIVGLMAWYAILVHWPELLSVNLPWLLSYKLFCVALVLIALVWSKESLNKVALSCLMCAIPLGCLLITWCNMALLRNMPVILFCIFVFYVLFFAILSFLFERTKLIGVLFDNCFEKCDRIKARFDLSLWFLLSLTLSVFGFSFMSLMWHNRSLLIFVFVVSCLNDVFGYVMGSIFGGVKIYPSISPNKTYFGSISGILTSVLVILVSRFLGTNFDYIPLVMSVKKYEIFLILFLILCTTVVSVCSQLGDWAISYCKRRVNRKNTGSILLSHGGLLDRLDSLVLPVILAHIMFSLFGV